MQLLNEPTENSLYMKKLGVQIRWLRNVDWSHHRALWRQDKAAEFHGAKARGPVSVTWTTTGSLPWALSSYARAGPSENVKNVFILQTPHHGQQWFCFCEANFRLHTPPWVRKGEVRSEPSSWLIAAVQTHSERSSWKNKVLHAVRQGGSRISVQQNHFTLPGNCPSKTHVVIRKTPSLLVKQDGKKTA